MMKTIKEAVTMYLKKDYVFDADPGNLRELFTFRQKIGHLRDDTHLNTLLRIRYVSMTDVLQAIRVHIGGQLSDKISNSLHSASWRARYFSSYSTFLKFINTFITDDQLQRERDMFVKIKQRKHEMVDVFMQRLEQHFTLGNLSTESTDVSMGELVRHFVRGLSTRDGFQRKVKDLLKQNGTKFLKLSPDQAADEWPNVQQVARQVKQEIQGYDEDSDGPRRSSSRPRSSERRDSEVRSVTEAIKGAQDGLHM
jgi:hypothetical protein